MQPSQSDGDLNLADYPYLAALNSAQLRAVTTSPDVPLQILAGPGSGKTRVLTARVAHLVKRHGLKPHQITAVTFTNKAANEMRKRLQVLLGTKQADQLVLGTFHATCARFLRRYGNRIGLKNSFAIAAADDSKKIMADILKGRKEELAEARISLKESAVLSDISKAKAKGETPEAMAERARRDPNASTSLVALIAELYEEYERRLRDSDSLDFDDLLVFGLRLFRDYPDILESCFHILVDEFQDTNTTQYELMLCFAAAHGGVSVVGDPDQSIYGWRSAEIENLNRMTKDFDNVQAIYLEENYRSTGSILSASHSIVSQDPKRIPKNLNTTHPRSTAVTLKMFATPVIEASFISVEIKRLVAYSGGLLNYDDFAILLRSNALSRVLESALQKEAIPNRIIGGNKFFDRKEIRDVLAYLQLADNPNFTPAFARVINVPTRGIGGKGYADIVAAAAKEKKPPMVFCEDLQEGVKLRKDVMSMKNKVASFVGVVRKVRRAALKGTPVAELIRLVLAKTNFEDHLRKDPDFEQRWDNVQELINYSVVVAAEQGRQVSAETAVEAADGYVSARTVPPEPPSPPKDDVPLHPMFRRTSASSRSRSTSAAPEKKPRKPRVKVENDIVEILSSDEDIDEPEPDAPTIEGPDGKPITPLRFFLQTSMLSTDTQEGQDEAEGPKVTISTVHSSKGLEWPVVFIPAVEQGTFPSYRCTEEHEIAEERRLLFVAMTRAQSFLTLSHSQTRMAGGEDNERDLSEFVAKSLRKDPNTFSSSLPTVDVEVRQQMAQMLGRPEPDEDATKELIMKHVRAAPPLSMWDQPEPRRKGLNPFGPKQGASNSARATEYWNSGYDDYALPPMGSEARGAPSGSSAYFTSARSMAEWPKAPSAPKPPVQRLQSSNRNMPAALPFAFEQSNAPRPEASLSSFASSSTSSLAAMKALGLPDDPPGATGAIGKQGAGAGPSAAAAFTTAAGNSIPLARGTKRLGMGRPAPWGTAKRAKQ